MLAEMGIEESRGRTNRQPSTFAHLESSRTYWVATKQPLIEPNVQKRQVSGLKASSLKTPIKVIQEE